MTINYYYILGCFLLLGFSCSETPDLGETLDLTYQTKSTYGYDLIWETALHEDSSRIFFSHRNVLAEGLVFYGRDYGAMPGSGFGDEMVALDKSTGQQKWTFHESNWRTVYSPLVIDGYAYYELLNRCVKLDLESGDPVWISDEAEANMRRLEDTDFGTLVTTVSYGGGFAYRNDIIEINKETGEIDVLKSLVSDDDFYHYVDHPQLFYNEKGEKILLYLYERVIYTPSQRHIDLVRFNITKDSLEWKVSDFGYTFESGTETSPIIKDERLYVHLVRDILCFDLHTGELLWKNEYNFTNFDLTNFIINDGILNSISDEGHVVGIDIETGQQKYFFDNGAMGGGITYYDGRLFYASEDLFILNHQTGEVMHEIRTKNGGGAFFRNKVVIDEETEIMYVQDGYFMQAIKIPE